MAYIPCKACNETGIGSDGEECRTCDGTGVIWVKGAIKVTTFDRYLRTTGGKKWNMH